MWTVEDRERYKDDGRRYPSDLTDAEWELVRSLFETYPERAKLFCYAAEGEDCQTTEIGNARLVVGRARVASAVTREWGMYDFAAVHFGDRKSTRLNSSH